MTRILLATLLGLALGSAATAQDGRVWIQVEAHPTLSEAQDRARDWASEFGDVAGFTLSSGWYGIVLGPYSEADARAFNSLLRRAGITPRAPGRWPASYRAKAMGWRLARRLRG